MKGRPFIIRFVAGLTAQVLIVLAKLTFQISNAIEGVANRMAHTSLRLACWMIEANFNRVREMLEQRARFKRVMADQTDRKEG